MPFKFLSLELPTANLFNRNDLQKKEVAIHRVSLESLLSKFDGKMTSNGARFQLPELPQYLMIHVKRFKANKFFLEKNNTVVEFPLRGLDMFPYSTGHKHGKATLFDLVASVVHVGSAMHNDSAQYLIQMLHPASGKWYAIRDLSIEEILPQTVLLSESYILCYERRDRQ